MRGTRGATTTVIRELSRVTVGKCVANRVVAFEFCGNDDFEQSLRGVSSLR